MNRNYFTILLNSCADRSLKLKEYITYVINEDEIYLHKYGIETYSGEGYDLPTKIWTTKDFGKIKFEDVTEDFLRNHLNNGK